MSESKYSNRKELFLLAALSSVFGFEKGHIRLKPFTGIHGEARERGKKKRKAKLRLISKSQRKLKLTLEYQKRHRANKNKWRAA